MAFGLFVYMNIGESRHFFSYVKSKELTGTVLQLCLRQLVIGLNKLFTGKKLFFFIIHIQKVSKETLGEVKKLK